MRTRSLLVAPLAAAAFLLSACTSGEPLAEPEQPTDDAAQTSASDVGVVQQPVGNGYLCRYVSESNQRAVAGGEEWMEPVFVTVTDEPDTWVCDARDGEEALVRVAIYRGEELPAQQRTAAQEAGLERGGPAHLGEAYLGDRQVTTVTRCHIRDSSGSGTYEPYSFVVEALSDDDADVRRDLTTVATAMARALDQAIGCSPKLALEEAPDDAAATTAP